MEQQASPYGLDQWITFLRDKPLPIHARTKLLMRNLFDSPDASLKQFQPVIASDPVLAVHAIGLANQLNRNPDTDVSTADLAVATLGMDHLHALTEKLPVIKINHQSVPHKQYFHTIANSYHAATQATNLCRFSNPAVVNETRTAALVYGVGHWALWRYAPRQMSEVKIRIYEQGADTALAEDDVLGCTIQDISQHLAESWHLSRLAVEALRHATSPDAEMLDKLHRYAGNNDNLSDADLREVKQLLNAPFYPVKLANWLSLTVPYGWTQPKALRLIELITDFLQQPPDDVIKRLHQNCLTASRQYHIAGILSPAAMLLLLPSDQVLSYRLESPSGVSTPRVNDSPAPAPQPAAEPEAEDSPMADEALYAQILKRLGTAPSLYSDETQLLTDLLRGLRLGLGLERVALFRAEQGNLAPFKQSGFARGELLPRFTQSLKVPSLFKKLAQKPLAVWINTDNRERIWAELPERFKGICHQHSLILTSLFIDGEARYIIYADRGDALRMLSRFDFKQFKQLATAASRCLSLPPTDPDPDTDTDTD